ncbi:AI-2E family transporter [Streptococcus sp. CSL10205-OR2]|uniref:AI-2E family transporter n=1 Tax=Streptococcus sp. CSL10205-OR2 TaxID=2980558 RepID=UPI0021DB2C3B|nr:AI-2E family transporter [Streptococcus sp. CSL10205-OR2]MCU9533196.1 AI-2E family transporter [Streptococcus sp. CSL10205-OR2]
MKLNKIYFYYVILTFALCYAIMTYWSTGEGILRTLYQASTPFLMGAAMAFVINIVMTAYERLFSMVFPPKKHEKIQKTLAMLLAYATFIIVATLIFTIVLPDLIDSLKSLLSINPSDVQKIIDDLQNNELVSRLLKLFGTETELSQLISQYSKQVLEQFLSVLTGVLSSVTSIASTLLSVFVSLVFSIYVLGNKKKLKYQFNLLVSTYLSKYEEKIHYVTDILNKRFHSFFVSQTLEAMILGSLSAIGMMLLGLPYAPTIGILIAFTAIIPVVGPYIGVTIGAILIMTQSLSQALVFLIFVVILQQFEGNIIYPRVVGGSIGLPSMWVLLSIAIGASLYGVLGMLLSVPLSASLYQIIKDNVAKKQAKKAGEKEVEAKEQTS